jgi:hypothetical protein
MSMRKSLVFIGAMSMALTSVLATPAAAQQNDRPPASVILEYCKPSFDPTQSVGECISAARADEEATATMFCLYLEDQGFLDAIDATIGECVTMMRAQR